MTFHAQEKPVQWKDNTEKINSKFNGDKKN